MDRLTKYSKETTHENGVCCTHFGGMECFACNGDCSRGCTWEEAAWSRLAAYEDTGLEPWKITAMQHTLDEYHKVADPLLRAQADGRLVVLPFTSGAHFAIQGKHRQSATYEGCRACNSLLQQLRNCVSHGLQCVL